MLSPKHRVVSAAAYAAGIVSCIAGMAVMGRAQDAPPPAKPETAGHRFKNIQVLKDLPADQLMPVMESYNRALGVRCSYCHVRSGPELDVKPAKKTARKMILMTQGLNKYQASIHNKATCYMCHRGQQEPQTQPGAGEEGEGEGHGEGRPVPPPPPGQRP